METIYINDKTDNFFIARWLFLKKRITQAEMIEYSRKPRDELIKILNDFNFKVKISGKKKPIFEPTGSELFANDELF